MNVELPGSAVKRTVVSDRKVASPVVRSSVDVVAVDGDEPRALAGLVAGQVLARHSALLLGADGRRPTLREPTREREPGTYLRIQSFDVNIFAGWMANRNAACCEALKVGRVTADFRLGQTGPSRKPELSTSYQS